MNTGPIADMVVGDMELEKLSLGNDELDTTSEDMEKKQLPDVELVTASGYGKNGGLCVLRRYIRPQSTFSFDQTDCQALWTIKYRSKDDNDNSTSSTTMADASVEDITYDKSLDKLLFISKSNSTLVSTPFPFPNTIPLRTKMKITYTSNISSSFFTLDRIGFSSRR
jgi:cleavage and polyadenylation specificity factor subunit 1